MRKKVGLIGLLLILTLGIVLGVYFLRERQDIRQRAAGGADLIVTRFMLTDAAGNVKTKFYENEDIYVRVSIRNQGDVDATSPNGRTYSQVYSNRSSTVAINSASDVGVSLDNGEFQAGASTRNYESRLNGRNQVAYVSNPYDKNSTRKYSWRKASAGTFTARVFLNFDQRVTETNFQNNQATLQYEVIPFTEQDEIGTQSLTKPADFDDYPCLVKPSAYIPGLEGCIQRVNTPVTKVQGRITNKTTTVQKVYIASYKAYLPYKDPGCAQSVCPEQYDFTWTQTFHRAEGYDLRPGDTIYLSTNLPSCAWQADLFVGDFPKSLHPNIPTYGDIGYIDGWYHFYPTYDQNNTQFCTASTPEPTPTITPTGTLTPTPTPSNTPTPNPSITSSPTPACVAPEQVTNVQISCPTCEP